MFTVWRLIRGPLSALVILASAASLSAVAPAASASAKSTDVSGPCQKNATATWPQFRFDSAHRGWAPFGSCVTTANVGRLKPLWAHGADGTYTDPVVADGKVVLTTRSNGRCGKIMALNGATGTTVWSHMVNAAICTDPIVVGKWVVMLSRNPLFVTAWTIGTGKRIWHRSLIPARWSGLTSSGGLLYLESFQGQVMGLKVSTGGAAWRTTLRVGLNDITPAVAGSSVYVSSQSGTVFAVSSKSGHLAWKKNTGIVDMLGQDTLAVSNGRLIVGADGTVYSFNLSSRKVQWRVGGGIYTPDLATDGKRVYAVSSPNGPHGNGPSVYGLDAGTGKTLWSYSTNFVGEKPEVANGIVYVSNDGVATASRFFALSAKTGKKLWSITGAGSYPSYPAIAGTRVYLSNRAFALK